MPEELEKESKKEEAHIKTEEIAPEVMHRSHTFKDDLSHAMNATDASVVQELLSEAREREVEDKEYRTKTSQRKWFSLFSIILLALAFSALTYGFLHYRKLTVPAEKNLSVGVFPSTDFIVAKDTDILQTISKIKSDITIKEGKVMLIPIVTDTETLSPISKYDFFKFIQSAPSEPLVASVETIRMGVLNNGIDTDSFVVMSVPDPQISSKEFLIAEEKLLQMFYKVLGIDISTHISQVGKKFESTYMYNLPVRVLYQEDPETKEQKVVLLYGYATNNILVVATKPQTLKAVYDTIIRQR